MLDGNEVQKQVAVDVGEAPGRGWPAWLTYTAIFSGATALLLLIGAVLKVSFLWEAKYKAARQEKDRIVDNALDGVPTSSVQMSAPEVRQHSSGVFIAEASLRSPRKLFICII